MRVPPGWLSLDLWAADRQLPPAKSFSAEFGTAFELVAGAQRFAFQADSRTAWWNSLELMLGFAPLVAGGQIYLHKFDLEKNVAPLLSPAARIAKADRLVVIDAGHGGGNTGTRSALDGSQEKDYTLDWALRLAPLLEQAGWRVLLTRTNDVELTLPERVDFTVSNRADLFLSLHFNASGGGSTQSGIETYCLTPSGLPSNLTRDSDDDVRQVFPNNSFDQENVQWATRLHSSLLKFTDANDRGVRRARFMGVLRQQRCPAVLIEGGYLSNPEEARRIASGGYRQRLAEAVAAALR